MLLFDFLGAIKDSKSDITRAETQPVRNMCPARPASDMTTRAEIQPAKNMCPASDMTTRSETQPVRNMCPARPASDMITRAETQPERNMCPASDMTTRAEIQSVRNMCPASDMTTRAEIQSVRNMCPASDMTTRAEIQSVRNMCPASDMTTRAEIQSVGNMFLVSDKINRVEIQPVRNMCPVFDMITRAETQSVRNSSPTSVGIEPNIKLEMFPMTEVGANQTIVNVFSSTKKNKNGVQNEAIIQKRSVSIADTRARGKKRPEDNKNDKLPGIKNQDNDSHTEYKKEVDAQAKAEMSPASTGKGKINTMSLNLKKTH